MLCFDRNIFFIPIKDGQTFFDVVDGHSNINSSCNDNSKSVFTETEQHIAVEKMLSTLVFPEELSNSK